MWLRKAPRTIPAAKADVHCRGGEGEGEGAEVMLVAGYAGLIAGIHTSSVTLKCYGAPTHIDDIHSALLEAPFHEPWSRRCKKGKKSCNGR
jgi:hypothetical protein